MRNARGNSLAYHLPTYQANVTRNRLGIAQSTVSFERSTFSGHQADKFHAWAGTRDNVLLPMMIFEKMPTAAKVMLLAMFQSRDGFRSFGMIHLISYTIASTATVLDNYEERTTAR